MDYVDVTKLVEEIEASKTEFEYLECRYEKCTIGMQIMETCREIAKVLLVLKNEQDNIVEQVECNMSEWSKENGFVIYQNGEYPYEVFRKRELCVLLRLYDLKSWDVVAEKVYGDADKAAFAKSEFEEYLKRFSNAEEQNEKAETDVEEVSGYLAELAKMMDELEELLHERDALMLRYLECLARLQAMERQRTDIS